MTLAERLKNEGRKKEKINIAIRLKNNGSDIDFISKITKLTTKELEEIFEANEENESK